MKATLILLAMSLCVNAILAYFLIKEDGDDFISSDLRQIQQLKLKGNSSLIGCYVGPDARPDLPDWPPTDEKLKEGVIVWIFRENGIARSVVFHPEQKWELDGDRILLEWPSSGFEYFGLYKESLITEDKDDYEIRFFRVE